MRDQTILLSMSVCMYLSGCMAADAIVKGPDKHFKPPSSQRLALIATTLQEQGRLDQAKTLFQKALEADPQNRQIAERLARLDANDGQHLATTTETSRIEAKANAPRKATSEILLAEADSDPSQKTVSADEVQAIAKADATSLPISVTEGPQSVKPQVELTIAKTSQIRPGIPKLELESQTAGDFEIFLQEMKATRKGIPVPPSSTAVTTVSLTTESKSDSQIEAPDSSQLKPENPRSYPLPPASLFPEQDDAWQPAETATPPQREVSPDLRQMGI